MRFERPENTDMIKFFKTWDRTKSRFNMTSSSGSKSFANGQTHLTYRDDDGEMTEFKKIDIEVLDDLSRFRDELENTLFYSDIRWSGHFDRDFPASETCHINVNTDTPFIVRKIMLVEDDDYTYDCKKIGFKAHIRLPTKKVEGVFDLDFIQPVLLKSILERLSGSDLELKVEEGVQPNLKDKYKNAGIWA